LDARLWPENVLALSCKGARVIDKVKARVKHRKTDPADAVKRERRRI
jgi:hypothetical protein